MTQKAELIELISRLPEEKVPVVIAFLKRLEENGANAANEGGQPVEPLQELLTTVIYSITNSLYDLSTEAERSGSKVMATRLNTYRKKMAEAWEVYKSQSDCRE